MIGTIGPIMIVTKVAMNWQNKLASATCPHVSAAASGFEFLQDITTFSDCKVKISLPVPLPSDNSVL